mmetsp:Transcript_52291/g.131314  ORF Transcript_52291/g.131314 Transcript_52291/m.131314 type:complete len:218 (+) Transcript_52291:3023-3676(+)
MRLASRFWKWMTVLAWEMLFRRWSRRTDLRFRDVSRRAIRLLISALKLDTRVRQPLISTPSTRRVPKWCESVRNVDRQRASRPDTVPRSYAGMMFTGYVVRWRRLDEERQMRFTSALDSISAALHSMTWVALACSLHRLCCSMMCAVASEASGQGDGAEAGWVNHNGCGRQRQLAARSKCRKRTCPRSPLSMAFSVMAFSHLAMCVSASLSVAVPAI